ncbi:hypothetical protein CDCA_CDCA04G1244 [Cyanidium caldarium]|uniref:Mitochondrial carrier protein n=1 Tax=Cyanidium caldarium TaxID=2771 RepID=A0AAV9IST5_CYACA|nr:hypothetical protein CDCA_CDCA04G1244 [Cyanidium caldarium]
MGDGVVPVADATSDEYAVRTPPPALLQFTAGAVAGVINTLVLNPLDVVRTRMQVAGAGAFAAAGQPALERRSVRDVVLAMWHTEGPRSFYRGVSASLVAFVPNWALYFALYEHFKGRLLVWQRRRQEAAGKPPSTSTLQRVFHHSMPYTLAAVGAGAITAVASSPLWVAKTRMQAEVVLHGNAPRYRHPLNCIAMVAREEGVGALYRGLAPALFGLVHAGIQFPLYEAIKQRMQQRRYRRVATMANMSPARMIPGSTEPHAFDIMVASALSKLVASTVAYPHEVLRSKMQVLQVSQSVAQSVPLRAELGRMLRIASETVRNEGLMGLYRGLGPTLMRTLPASVLTFVSYEACRSLLHANE